MVLSHGFLETLHRMKMLSYFKIAMNVSKCLTHTLTQCFVQTWNKLDAFVHRAVIGEYWVRCFTVKNLKIIIIIMYPWNYLMALHVFFSHCTVLEIAWLYFQVCWRHNKLCQFGDVKTCLPCVLSVSFPFWFLVSGQPWG